MLLWSIMEMYTAAISLWIPNGNWGMYCRTRLPQCLIRKNNRCLVLLKRCFRANVADAHGFPNVTEVVLRIELKIRRTTENPVFASRTKCFFPMLMQL